MAEQVQAVLDQMVPALRDLMDKGIFSETEIKAIVTRRRTSEYLLRRRAPRKADYARYIEAEQNLEKLRHIRNKRFLARRAAKERDRRAREKGGEEKKSTGGSGSGSIGDASIVQHLHLLFARAKRKWKQDLTWHLQHAEFSKRSASFTILGKIYAEALQIHPRNSSLWIEAASHEFFGSTTPTDTTSSPDPVPTGGGSIKNARVLLQRGLRINPTSQELWLQSFSLELHYIQKLRGRRELLQLDQRTIVRDEDDDGQDKDGAGEEVEGIEALYEGAKLPRVVYRNAVRAISDDVAFRLSFVECCRRFPRTDKVVEDVMQSIQEDFDGVEEAWIARARYIVEKGTATNSGAITAKEENAGLLKDVERNDEDGENVDEAEMSRKRKRIVVDTPTSTSTELSVLQLMDEATTTLPTTKMYIESITFLLHHLLQLDEDETLSPDDHQAKMSTIAQYLPRLLTGPPSTTTTPQLTILTAEVHLALGQPLDAARALRNAVQSKSICRNDARCWMRWAEIATRMQTARPPTNTNNKDDTERYTPRRILRDALNTVPIHDGGHYRLLARLFRTLLATAPPPANPRGASGTRPSSVDGEIADIYRKLLLLHHRRSDGPEGETCLPTLALAYVRRAVLSGDLGTARRVYRGLLFESGWVGRAGGTEEEVAAVVELYESCIAMEVVAMEDGGENGSGRKVGRAAVGMLYDRAIEFWEGREDVRLADEFRKRKLEDLA